MKKIVVIGGGFGGVYTARNLNRLFGGDVEITLINKSNYFIFTPLLHEVATGALTSQSITESLHEIFRGTSVICIEDTVLEIDKENRIVKTINLSFTYDFLVMSPGAETNYFNIPGARENSFPLKNIDDAIKLKSQIISVFEKANSSKNKSLLSFAVVGAGATGVELATELTEYAQHILNSYYRNSSILKSDIKISMITGTPDVISQFPIKMREIAFSELRKKGINVLFNTIVADVKPGILTFKNGETLEANTIIWVAGVKPSLVEIKGAEFGPKGRMETNEFLQSATHPEIFSLGDASGTHPMLAQIAVEQAKTVAQNIYSIANGRNPEKFTTDIKGLLISLGQWSAAGQIGKVTLHGPFMWWVWRTIYLFNFNSWKKRLEIAVEWTINLFYPRDITIIK
jgi:NADH dehydrogenase